MTELTREQMTAEDIQAIIDGYGGEGRFDLVALCNLALSALEGEEVVVYQAPELINGFRYVETHADTFRENMFRDKGWTVRRFRLVPVEG